MMSMRASRRIRQEQRSRRSLHGSTNRLEIRHALVNYYIDTHPRRRPSSSEQSSSEQLSSEQTVSDDETAGQTVGTSALLQPVEFVGGGGKDAEMREAPPTFSSIASATAFEYDPNLIVLCGTVDAMNPPFTSLVRATSCHCEVAAAAPSSHGTTFVTSATAGDAASESNASLVHDQVVAGERQQTADRDKPQLTGTEWTTWIVGDGPGEICRSSVSNQIGAERQTGSARSSVLSRTDTSVRYSRDRADVLYAYASLRGACARVLSISCVFARSELISTENAQP
jgi:hypothetical protein